MDIQPFHIHVPESDLSDLLDRLIQTRWPDEIEGAEWDYGSNLAYTKELVEYWISEFEWRPQEASLNSLSNFRAEVDDGLSIHFIHEKGVGPDPMPLIITHGWPSSIAEMQKIIPLLTDPGSHGGDPAAAFDVVVPSMPGYGYSDRPKNPGMNPTEIARLWHKLMTEGLGYERFAAQGGDWGSAITSRLGFDYPDNVAGIHITMAGSVVPTPPDSELTDAERQHVAERAEWQQSEGGYGHIQGTKPQTLAYGLNDSPAGLAAWIVEKFRTWSDCNGDVETRFTKEELLTNIAIYWFTQSISSSVRLYYESRRSSSAFGFREKVTVPTAFAAFPVEIGHPPREWVERAYNVQRWTQMPTGGHFAAQEEPELLAQDIREFFSTVR